MKSTTECYKKVSEDCFRYIKLQETTKEKFKKDTYVDAANYLYQAEEMHKAEEKIFNTDGIIKDQVDG